MNDVLNIYSTFCLHMIYLVTEKPHAGFTTHQNELILRTNDWEFVIYSVSQSLESLPP